MKSKDTIKITSKESQNNISEYLKAVSEKIKRDSDAAQREHTVIKEQIEDATKGKTITVEKPNKSNFFSMVYSD
ncbi:MAG: hypothetical protein R3B92_02770 [Patescibacteria group bacterium]